MNEKIVGNIRIGITIRTTPKTLDSRSLNVLHIDDDVGTANFIERGNRL